MQKYIKLFEDFEPIEQDDFSDLFGIGLGGGSENLDKWIKATVSERLNGISPEVYVDPLTSSIAGWRSAWALRLLNTEFEANGRKNHGYVLVEVYSTTTPENEVYLYNKISDGPEIWVSDNVDNLPQIPSKLNNPQINTTVKSESERLKHGTGPIQVPVDRCSSAAEAVEIAIRHATLLIETLPQRIEAWKENVEFAKRKAAADRAAFGDQNDL
jgi:hypothetical protein